MTDVVFPQTQPCPVSGCCEPFSCYSHLVGAFAFAYLTILLLQRGRHDRSRCISLGVFGASSVLLLLVSSLYHMFAPGDAARAVLMRIDIASIFVLIAGTYTPAFALLYPPHERRRGLLQIWTLALAGLLVRMLFFDVVPDWVGVAMFLALGWSGLFATVGFWRRFGFRFVKPLLLGGMVYSAGASLLLLGWPVLLKGVIGPHELWHVAVLLGLALHWNFVWQFAAEEPEDVLAAGTCARSSGAAALDGNVPTSAADLVRNHMAVSSRE